MFRRKKGNRLVRTQGRATQGHDLGSRLKGQRVGRKPNQPPWWRGEAILLAFGLLFLGLRKATVLGLVMGFSALLLLGSYVMLAHGSTFAVQQAIVQGNHNLSSLEVLQAAGVTTEACLLTLPVRRAMQGLMRVPLVEKASVERVWPHTVRIEVVERRPFAMALVEGQLHFLDKEMRPFAPVGAQDSVDLPVITGLSRADLLEPDEEMVELLMSAHRLLDTLPQRAIKGGGALSEVHVDRIWGLSAVFSDLPATVRLGFGNYEDEWPRLEKVCADLKERGEMERAVLIDLDSDRRVVVRLGREAA